MRNDRVNPLSGLKPTDVLSLFRTWCLLCEKEHEPCETDDYGIERTPENVQAAMPRVGAAQYDGHCSGCSMAIDEGQMIAWLPDHQPTHEECWPS